jgi:hypothetical protein
MAAALITIGLLVFLTLAFGAVLLILSELWRVTAHHGVPSISSSWGVVDADIEAKALPDNGLILDLGAGTGWALRRMWRSGQKGPHVGYEEALAPWLVATLWNRIMTMPVKVKRADLFTAPLEDAAGIYLFLMPATLAKLSPELKRRTRPGTRIVSAEFPLPGWEPSRVLTAHGITSSAAKIYCYVRD